MSRHFESLCAQSGLIDHGLRHDVFLVADTASITSAPQDQSLIKGYIKAIDVAYDPGKTYDEKFEGVLKVGITHISTTFYNRLLPRGQVREEVGPQHADYYKQSWEMMAYKSRYDQEERVYPPNWKYSG